MNSEIGIHVDLLSGLHQNECRPDGRSFMIQRKE